MLSLRSELISRCLVLAHNGERTIETERSSRETIDFAVELDTNAASFSAATPFAGTPLEKKARGEGRLGPDGPPRVTSSVPSMGNEAMSAAEIGRLCRMAKARWREHKGAPIPAPA